MNFAELTEAVNKKLAVIRKKQQIVNAHQAELNDLFVQCTHDEYTKELRHWEGGYDYRSGTDTWNQCTLCGHIFNMQTKLGSFQ